MSTQELLLKNTVWHIKKTKKAAFLWDLLELSYAMECEPEDWEGIQLERYIAQEKNANLKEALVDLDM